MEREINSLLDTDLYKFTMQAAVLKHHSNAYVTYKLKNRTSHKVFSKEAYDWLQKQILSLGELNFSCDDLEYLKKNVPQLPEEYLKYLKSFKLNPSKQVTIEYDEKSKGISIFIHGLWVETILYELPLLALVSTSYFKFIDTDWNENGQLELAKNKCIRLLDSGCVFSEFGTRRRRSFYTQRIVLEGIKNGVKEMDEKNLSNIQNDKKSGKFLGTSNVYFAREFGVQPIGTVAHEWMMGIAAITQDYKHANTIAMKEWVDTFGPKYAGVALTDTFGTEAFLKEFTKPYLDIYTGIRQDSGNPEEYTEILGKFYASKGYPRFSKSIVYSDSLDIDKCIKYKKVALDSGLNPAFGIGTFFTNDFKCASLPEKKSEPLNIVIKLFSANDHNAIKISDNINKNTGDVKTVNEVKKILGYTEHQWKGGDEEHRWTVTA